MASHTAVEKQARIPPQGFRASHSGFWPGGGRQRLCNCRRQRGTNLLEPGRCQCDPGKAVCFPSLQAQTLGKACLPALHLTVSECGCHAGGQGRTAVRPKRNDSAHNNHCVKNLLPCAKYLGSSERDQIIDMTRAEVVRDWLIEAGHEQEVCACDYNEGERQNLLSFLFLIGPHVAQAGLKPTT